MYAVGADQHVGGCYDTILKPSLDPVVVLPDFYTAMREMYPLWRHGFSQYRVQFSAMKDEVGRPKLGLDRLSKRRARERATILPPALVEEGDRNATSASSGPSPRRISSREAFGPILIPAPTSESQRACS